VVTLTGVSIHPNEVVNSLKKDIRFREVCYSILSQRVIEQAATARSLTVTIEEIEAEAEKLRREKRLEKAADTLAWLADQMITPDDWEAGIRDRLLTKKLAESLFSKEVEKLFAQNRLDFEQILLYQIVVPYERLAQELFYQIEEQEISFYEAAHLYDIDERRRELCGCEGKLYRWSLKPGIAALVFNAQIGELIGPQASEHGYHLFRVEAFIPAELTPEIYQNLLDKMFKEWLMNEITYMIHSQTS